MKYFLIVLLLLPTFAQSAFLLDQEYAPALDLRSGPSTFQSFTAGITGNIAQIDLLVATIDGGDRDLIINIWDFGGDSLLGGVSITPEEFSVTGNSIFLPIDFSEIDIPIISGTMYFIEMTEGMGTTHSVNWDGTSRDGYGGGSRAFRAFPSGDMIALEGDYGFKTYVTTVPLPGAMLLFLSGLSGVFLVRKKKLI